MDQTNEQHFYPSMDFACQPWYSSYTSYDQPYPTSFDQVPLPYQSVYDQQQFCPPMTYDHQSFPVNYDQMYQQQPPAPFYGQQPQVSDYPHPNQWCAYPLLQEHQQQQPLVNSELVANCVNFGELPTTLSPELYDELPQNFTGSSYPNEEDDVAEEEQDVHPNVEEGEIARQIFVPVPGPPTTLASDEKIRFRNRDYYGLPVQLNVTKTSNNCCDQTIMYNLTAKKKSPKQQRGKTKRTPTRNPLSTKLTVKNLKKLLEMQEKILPSMQKANENEESTTSARSISDGDNVGDDQGTLITQQNSTITSEVFVRPATAPAATISSEPSSISNDYERFRSSSATLKPVKKNTFRNRSYEFDSLQFGSFVVVSDKQNLSPKKLRFYFGQKQMVYDFEYNYPVPSTNTSIVLQVMIYVHLDSIKQAIFRSRDVQFFLSQTPRIVSGFDRSKIPDALKATNFGTTTIDVTNGQLNKILYHQINLRRAQGGLIEKFLLSYNPDLKTN